MTQVTRHGNLVHTEGELPSVGSVAPPFSLTNADLQDVSLEACDGQATVLNILHSVDTPVCAASVKRFRDALGGLEGVTVLHISADLPFAQKRFCASEQLQGLAMLSTFRSPAFGTDYGVRYTDGPLAGLMSRSVLVLDRDHRVVHAEQVGEVSLEPDYDAVLAAVRGLGIEPAAPRRAGVLVLDDELAIRELMKSILGRLGHDVTVTETADAAMAAYREQFEKGQAFDLVIVDLHLGDSIGGAEVMAELRRVNPEVNVVACSGSYAGNSRMVETEHGFAAFLPKPFQVADLRDLAARFL
jgi:thiol peroxidase